MYRLKGSFDCGCAPLREVQSSLRMTGLRVVVCALVVIAGVVAHGQTARTSSDPRASAAPASTGQGVSPQASSPQGLVIEPEELPGTYPQGTYEVRFHARGNYVPVLHWKLEKGALPQGIKLQDDGTLHGQAQRPGEFQFTVSVKDGGQPQQAVQKQFTIKVVEAIAVAWKVPAHVNVSRIEGSVEVSNTTADDMDLTFDVKAVAENGRATEIGYQHYVLTKGTIGMALPFGENLPHGAYVVYVNVVGEVPQRNAIYRQQLETARALQVVPGP
jgi:hypothetical protein